MGASRNLGPSMSPLSVSELQWLAIANAAAALCPSDRDQFIARVHAALRGQPIGDGTIGAQFAQCRSVSRTLTGTRTHREPKQSREAE